MVAINLSHEKIWVRILFTYIIFFILLFSSIGIGFFLLPEGSLKEIPFLSLLAFEEETTLVNLIIQTLFYNSFLMLLIVLTNHYQVKSFNLGYLALFVNVVILGLFAGTNSFSGEVSTFSLEGWILFFQVGFLEFSAYILICCATVDLTMFRANKWRGEQFKKIRKFKEAHISKKGGLIILIAIILLIIAAINEWSFISS